jgi:hypothetical protein
MEVEASEALYLPELETWLGLEPVAEAGDEAEAFAVQFAEFADGAWGTRRGPLRAALAERAMDTADRLASSLIESELTFQEPLYGQVRRFVLALVGLAHDHLRDGMAGGSEHRAEKGLKLLLEAWLLAGMSCTPMPFGFWTAAHELGEMAGGPRSDAYRSLLALGVAFPESLSPRELLWLSALLEAEVGCVEVVPYEERPDCVFWIDPAQDQGPVTQSRRSPPPVDGLLGLSAGALAKRIGALLEWLERSTMPIEPERDVAEAVTDGRLPEGLSEREMANLMRRLRAAWAMPPLRETPRRRQAYAVELCIGLRAIWQLRQGGEENPGLSKWQVVNESSGGYSLTGTADADSCPRAGMAVALRAPGGAKWAICLVRWLRARGDGQLDLGLQVVAQGGVPVILGFRGAEPRIALHGLILPPFGTLRRNQAILAPVGASVSQRFVFTHEGERLYVAQGRALGVDLQTASVELFQFEPDPFPI